MEIKMKFARVIAEREKLSEEESRAVILEIDKLQNPHPNIDEHMRMSEEIAQMIWHRLADKYKKHVKKTGDEVH